MMAAFEEQKQKQQRAYLKRCRAELQAAEESGDKARTSLAHANLGYALFQKHIITEGLPQFEKAEALAVELEDVRLQIKGLSIKSMAFQLVKRLPDAYTTAQQIQQLAESIADRGLQCDALASQGQIVLDSGEPIVATEHFQKARDIALELGDKRRYLNILGGFGNLSLAIAAGDQAEAYFEKAVALARELDDEEAELHYLGNLGIVLYWNGQHERAAQIFEHILAHARSQNDSEVERSAIKHLVKVHVASAQPSKTIDYVRQGLIFETDYATRRMYQNQLIDALVATGEYQQAIDVATEALCDDQVKSDPEGELDLLLKMGNAYYESNDLEAAKLTYEQALPLPKQINKDSVEARILGQLGIIHADLGDLERAITYTSGALDLAKQFKDERTAGELMCVLALNYQELGQLSLALEHCGNAIVIFERQDAPALLEQALTLQQTLQNDLSLVHA